MSRAYEPAYPGVFDNTGDMNVSAPNGEVVAPECYVRLHGLTIREHFAGLAMQGLLAKPGDDYYPEEAIARKSVKYADALISELAKPVKP